MARAYKHTDVAVLNWAVKYLVVQPIWRGLSFYL